MSQIKYKFRDVSEIFQKLRLFLRGRDFYILRSRFPPLVAPRTLPVPDIPRGPVYKYSDQYYFRRTALDSVHPPVVAPVALGEKMLDPKKAVVGTKPQTVTFPTLPTPGYAYWFDAHCYYVNRHDPRPPPADPKPEPPPPPPPCEPVPRKAPDPTPCDPCAPFKK